MTVFCRWEVPSNVRDTADSDSTPSGRTLLGPEPKRPSTLWPEIPPDLDKALAEHGAARQNFEAFPPSTRKAILTWIGTAKRPETRAKRVEETARLAAENIRAHQ